jgi:large subunit ribosomal protein L35
MPKIKTNRMAYKKLRVNAKGKIKRAQAYKSHNTAKKSPKRKRQLRACKIVDSANMRNVRRQLPNSGV